jgi:hypothetical protein
MTRILFKPHLLIFFSQRSEPGYHLSTPKLLQRYPCSEIVPQNLLYSIEHYSISVCSRFVMTILMLDVQKYDGTMQTG